MGEKLENILWAVLWAVNKKYFKILIGIDSAMTAWTGKREVQQLRLELDLIYRKFTESFISILFVRFDIF